MCLCEQAGVAAAELAFLAAMSSTCMAMLLGDGVARTDAEGANWPFSDHITRPEPSSDHAQVGRSRVSDHAQMQENSRSRSRRGTDHASKTDVWTGSNLSGAAVGS